jgi:DNA ligase-1
MKFIATHPPIYKRDTNGGTRVWQMQSGYNDENTAGHQVISGVLNGKMITSEWKICKPKNVGKANSTTAVSQAEAEVAALYTKKLDTGYFENIENIDSFDKFKPMLAHDYNDYIPTFKKKTFSQPKFDGGRCEARADGLWSRTGKRIVSCPHIERSLEAFFKKNPTVVLDGELYNHKLKDDFNKIMSLVRQTKPTDQDLIESESMVEYHIYDYIENKTDIYTERLYKMKTNLVNVQYIELAKTDVVISQEQLDALYIKYLEDGYEGQMVRDDVAYENKRTKHLLKRKEFITDEFPVVEILEGVGNWAGYAKRFVVKLPSGVNCGSGVKGDRKTLKELWDSQKNPDWATVRYFTPTPDGIPRFPVVIDFGYGKRED